MKASPTSFLFVVLMSLLGALSAFATDMSLSATETMARDFVVTPGDIGLTLSAFMASFALSPLVYGPLSDRYGRRPIALLACTIYALGGLGCALSHSLGTLLMWRFVQGIGGGARPLALAMIGDHFKGAAAREKMSYVSALGLLAPVLAPTIGAVFLGFGGWRLIYVFLTLTGVIALVLVGLKLGESLPQEARVAVSPRAVASHYLSVFRTTRSLPYALIAVAMFGVIFGYVSGSPFVMIGTFKLSPTQFGLTFALNSAGLLIGNLMNARLNRAGFSPILLLAGGLSLLAAGMAALVVATWSGNASVAAFIPCLVLCMMGCAISNTNALQLAIEPLSHIAGTASAAVVSTQLAFGALAGFLVAHLYDGHTARSTVTTMAFAALVGLLAFACALRMTGARRTTKVASATT